MSEDPRETGDDEPEAANSGARVSVVRPPYAAEVFEEVKRFYYSLGPEFDIFHLALDQIFESKILGLLWSRDGRVAGVAGVRARYGVWMFFMVMRADHQGQGHGRNLTRTVMGGVPPTRLVLLTVQRSNMKARKLYKSSGFVTINRHKGQVTMLYNRGIGPWLRLPLIVAVFARNLFVSHLAG